MMDAFSRIRRLLMLDACMPAHDACMLMMDACMLKHERTTMALLAHRLLRLLKLMPLMHSSDALVLVGTICIGGMIR